MPNYELRKMINITLYKHTLYKFYIEKMYKLVILTFN